MDTITRFNSRDGRLISYDPADDLLVVEQAEGGVAIVIDLSNARVTIRTEGDLTLEAGGHLRLRGRKGVEIEADGDASLHSAGDLKLIGDEETTLRGTMVRIN